MTEKVGVIKNPLTVIAIFAGLAEVGGTIVLPLLVPEVQRIYVWFLMGFPTILVSAFFFVLYKKHHVLYAPSDFKEDGTFASLISTTAPAGAVSNLEQVNSDSSGAENSGAIVAANAKPSGEPPFNTLSANARKVMKSLWQFQQYQFGNDDSRRWGFTVGPGAPDFAEFMDGVIGLRDLRYVALNSNFFCFLTDHGLKYCKENDTLIEAEPLHYKEFSARPTDSPAA